MSSAAPVPPAPTELETALTRAGQRPRFIAGEATVDPGRLLANRIGVEVELDAPRPTRLTRLLVRMGIGERTIPLVTATPALRRSWLAAVVVALLFAVNATSNGTGEGAERIVAFLTVAPLVPLLGVALAFGRGVDPTHELVLAAPMDAFRVFLVRAATVLSASTVVLLVASILVPAEGGAARVAWLLPALAVTAVTMALATRIEPRLAAGVVAAAWITIVVVVSQAADPATMFGAPSQLACLALAVVGAGVFHRRRRRLDTITVEAR